MASPYDENLLAAAPAATRAELQEGYNVDLLNDEHSRRSHSGTPPLATTPRKNETDPELGQTKESYAGRYNNARTSFYRRRGVVIAMVIAFIVIVAAVIGGAVGGTRKHKSSSGSDRSSANIASSTSTSASSAQAASGPVQSAGSQQAGSGVGGNDIVVNAALTAAFPPVATAS